MPSLADVPARASAARPPQALIADLVALGPDPDEPCADLEWLDALADALGRLGHGAARAASDALAAIVADAVFAPTSDLA